MVMLVVVMPWMAVMLLWKEPNYLMIYAQSTSTVTTIPSTMMQKKKHPLEDVKSWKLHIEREQQRHRHLLGQEDDSTSTPPSFSQQQQQQQRRKLAS